MKSGIIASTILTSVMISAGVCAEPSVIFLNNQETVIGIGETDLEISFWISGGPITANIEILDSANNNTSVFSTPFASYDNGLHTITWDIHDVLSDKVPSTYSDFLYPLIYTIMMYHKNGEGQTEWLGGEGIGLYFEYLCTQLDVIHPNGGEILQSGSEYTIEWIPLYTRKAAIFDAPFSHIYLSTDAGSTWQSFGAGYSGNKTINLPNISSDSCLIKVVHEDGAEDISDGFFTITTVTSASDDNLPAAFSAGPASPNPFNPSTTIPIDLPEAGYVRAIVYNLIGQRITVLADGDFPSGRHMLSWRATGSAAGVYVCQVEYAGKTRAVKVTLAK